MYSIQGSRVGFITALGKDLRAHSLDAVSGGCISINDVLVKRKSRASMCEPYLITANGMCKPTPLSGSSVFETKSANRRDVKRKQPSSLLI